MQNLLKQAYRLFLNWNFIYTYKWFHVDESVKKNLKQDKCFGEPQIVHWQWSKIFPSLYTTIIINSIICLTWHPLKLSVASLHEHTTHMYKLIFIQAWYTNIHRVHISIQIRIVIEVTTQNHFLLFYYYCKYISKQGNDFSSSLNAILKTTINQVPKHQEYIRQ